MIKQVFAGSALALASLVAFTVSAQNDEPTPEQQAVSATETRQAVFKLLGYNMGAIGGMARGDIEFDAEVATRNARRIEALAPMIPELFARMDTRDFDVDSEALPIIWEQAADFESHATDLVEAAATFASVAEAGDRMEILGQVRAFGATCGNCHDIYRED